ncbi:MAG: hypothetical protein JST51_03120 [Armatimonadetes bacterium]|nr:hypothetical protein [Armatimonadota bacterium]
MRLYRMGDEGPEQIPAFDCDSYEVFRYPDGTECLVVRVVSDRLGFLRLLLGNLDQEVKILYILVQSIQEGEVPGRYLSPVLSPSDAIRFLDEFGDFLVEDARHEFWFMTKDRRRIVCDIHDRIWLYGHPDWSMPCIEEFGIPNGIVEPISFPHSHRYAFGDTDLSPRLRSLWEWHYSPLDDRDGE